jgi:hypothetical protein
MEGVVDLHLVGPDRHYARLRKKGLKQPIHSVALHTDFLMVVVTILKNMSAMLDAQIATFQQSLTWFVTISL